MSKKLKLTTKYLNELIEQATTDAYNESEQAGGFFVMIEENLALPFVTQVLGQEVTVAKVDITKRDQIVAICVRGSFDAGTFLAPFRTAEGLVDAAKNRRENR